MIDRINSLYSFENQGLLSARNSTATDKNINIKQNNPSFKASLANLQNNSSITSSLHKGNLEAFDNQANSRSITNDDNLLNKDDFLLNSYPGKESDENLEKDVFIADLKQKYGYSLNRLDDDVKAFLVKHDFDLIKSKEFAYSFYQDANQYIKNSQSIVESSPPNSQTVNSELQASKNNNQLNPYINVDNQPKQVSNDQHQQLEILSQILTANPPQVANQNLDNFLARFAANTKANQNQAKTNSQALPDSAQNQQVSTIGNKQTNDFRSINYDALPRFNGQSQMPYGSIESKITKQEFNQNNSNSKAINHNVESSFGSKASLKLDLDHALTKYEHLV